MNDRIHSTASPARPYSRRTFLRGAAGSSALLASSPSLFAAPRDPAARADLPETAGAGRVDPALAAFIASYMAAMHAPGMTLALVAAGGAATTAAFGWSDVAARLPVTPGMLFEIGSISKSFCALSLLQMHDEGKLDLHRPILGYLPWLPLETTLGQPTVHDLLTHSAGLTHNFPLFQTDPNARIPLTSKPGTKFAYSNLGYEILGRLASHLDGKSYASVVKTRVIDRLAMTSTVPSIDPGMWSRLAGSYSFFRSDVAPTLDAPLRPVSGGMMNGAAGCIASTPADMTLYLKMLLAQGATPHGRIVSEASFALFSTPFLVAPELGPGLSYGYGVAVETVDGRKVLMHTGGMESFASAFHADLDAKVAAFASINAMQGYRPLPVTNYAVARLRAAAEGKPLPSTPPLPSSPLQIDNAADYAGEYTGPEGKLQLVAEGKTLLLVSGGTHTPLQRLGGDIFGADADPWRAYALAFGRERPATPDGEGAVSELQYGPHWYANARYAGPRSFPEPEALRGLPGIYTDGHVLSQVYFVKGALTLDGDPLEDLGGSLFRVNNEPGSPDRVRFQHVVDGEAQTLLFNGDLWGRIEPS